MNRPKYEMCAYCLKRENLSSNPRRAIVRVPPRNCFLCKGAVSELGKISSKVIQQLADFEYETFQMGATLPQELLNREDEIRSAFKIRGRESVKSQITRGIGRRVAKATGKKLDYVRPDVTVLVSISNREVSVFSRSIWALARYLKKERGLPQKGSLCRVCNGLGCASCNYGSSLQSIQAILTEFLKETFRAEGCNFIWIGSEDENSLVSGNGRPFFVEILKPKKRALRATVSSRAPIDHSSEKQLESVVLDESKSVNHGKIQMCSFKILPAKPTAIPQFKIQCKINLLRDGSVTDALLDANGIESEFKNSAIRVRGSKRYKVVTRHIESISVEQNTDTSAASLLVRCDGGIPIKKLVSCEDDSVIPCLSSHMKGYEIDRARPFDILRVDLVSDRKNALA